MMAGDGWVSLWICLLQMMTGHSINATSLVLGYGSISQLLAGNALTLQKLLLRKPNTGIGFGS
jgi:hypothetical protein